MTSISETKAINDEFNTIQSEILALQVSNPPVLSDIVLSLEKLENLQLRINRLIKEDTSKGLIFPVTLKKAENLRSTFLNFFDDQSRDVWAHINLWKTKQGEVEISSLQERVGWIQSIESANPYLEFRLERLSRMHNDLNAIKRKLFSDVPRQKIQKDQEAIQKRHGQKIEFQSGDIEELEQVTKQTWKPEEVQPLNTKEWKDETKQAWKREEVQPLNMKEWKDETKQAWKREEVQPLNMKEWDNDTKQPRKAELVRPILHSIETVSKRHAEKWAANTAKATTEPPPPLNKSLISRLKKMLHRQKSDSKDPKEGLQDDHGLEVQENKARSYAHIRKQPNTRPFRKSVVRDPNHPISDNQWIKKDYQ